MAAIKPKNILILTPFFSPNIGGVETHLDDLVKKLDQLSYHVYVQTFSPITTPGVSWKKYEQIGENIEIRRYFWFGRNLFHKIEKYPFFDFLYLTPYLFFRTFLWLLANSKKIDVIHAQGLNASLAGLLLKIIFKKRLITSIHAIYETNPRSKTAKIISSILNYSDHILTLSKASQKELLSFSVIPKKLHVYRYWVQAANFYPMDKLIAIKKTGLEDKFTVLFVGRLIKKKGVHLLVKIAKSLPNVNFVFIGSGPESTYLSSLSSIDNIKYIGKIENNRLINHYNSADIFCIPSLYEEGFGRVVMEAVSCGLPVVGSNKGGISEALDSSVSILDKPTFKILKSNISKISQDKKMYKRLKSNTKRFSLNNFSDKNIELIIRYY
jgi:glycosyltransferase involved in cell wall biosynthesis